MFVLREAEESLNPDFSIWVTRSLQLMPQGYEDTQPRPTILRVHLCTERHVP